jgi:hypothetical protein
MGLARLLAITVALLLLAAPAARAADVTFDPVPLGTTPDVREIEFVNDGADEITLGVASLTGTDAGSFRIDPNYCLNDTLAPGEGCSLFVNFDPRRMGINEATLQIPVTDTGEVVTTTLAGEGRESLRVSPGLVDFGAVPISAWDAIPPREVVVENVSGETLSGLGTRFERLFSLHYLTVNNTCDGATLTPGALCRLSVMFRQRRSGSYADTLQVTKQGRTLASVPVRGPVNVSAPPRTPAPPRPRTPDVTSTVQARLQAALKSWRKLGPAGLRRGGFLVTGLTAPVDGATYLLVRARGKVVAQGSVFVKAGKRARLRVRATRAGRQLLAAKKATRLAVVLKFVAGSDQRVSRVERTLRVPAA